MHRRGGSVALLAAGALAIFALGQATPAIAQEAAVAVHKIKGSSIAKHSVAGNRLKKNTVTGKQIKESSLGVVPVAAKAKSLPPLTWHNVTLKNGWVAGTTNYGPPQWALDPDGIVHLRGFASGGTSGSVVFSLPASLKPANRIGIPMLNNNNAVSYLFIDNSAPGVEAFNTSGDTSVGSGVFFNGISFDVG
jgi:hypothetical protein